MFPKLLICYSMVVIKQKVYKYSMPTIITMEDSKEHLESRVEGSIDITTRDAIAKAQELNALARLHNAPPQIRDAIPQTTNTMPLSQVQAGMECYFYRNPEDHIPCAHACRYHDGPAARDIRTILEIIILKINKVSVVRFSQEGNRPIYALGLLELPKYCKIVKD